MRSPGEFVATGESVGFALRMNTPPFAQRTREEWGTRGCGSAGVGDPFFRTAFSSGRFETEAFGRVRQFQRIREHVLRGEMYDSLKHAL